MSHVMRKAVYVICEQQRRRSACASAQSDQRLCCSLPGYYNTSICYSRNFKLVSAAEQTGLSHTPGRKPRRQDFLWRGSYDLYAPLSENWIWQRKNEPPHDKSKKMACAPSEDSDQPGHPPSLIKVSAVRMKKAWVLSYPLSTQWSLRSDWADAQADLSLRWAHSHFDGFVMRRLKSCLLVKMRLVKHGKLAADSEPEANGFCADRKIHEMAGNADKKEKIRRRERGRRTRENVDYSSLTVKRI